MAQPPPEIPPQQYGSYYRPPTSYQGSSAKLEALAAGYYGLNVAFVINIVCALFVYYGLPAIIIAQGLNGPTGFEIMLGAFVLLAIAIVFITLPYNRKIAFGMGWSPGGAVLASILIAVVSFVCCGIIGYVVMQQIAGSEMKKYGLKTRFLGIRKADVLAAVEALKQAEMQASTVPPQA